MMARTNGTGRHDIARVPEPIQGYASLPTSVHSRRSEIAAVAVADVYDAQRRVRALARMDLLDRERRSGKISEAAFIVGREVETVFESMHRVSGGGQWLEGDRIDAATSHDIAMVYGMERAAVVNAFLAWLLRHLGKMDARLLWIVLGHRLSLATAAAAFGRRGVRGYRYTVDRFRDALAVLAETKAAKGRDVRRALR
jgi:hypothetical protein